MQEIPQKIAIWEWTLPRNDPIVEIEIDSEELQVIISLHVDQVLPQVQS
jgi:hypothetical protein